MTSKEVFEKINEVIEKKELSRNEICAAAGINKDTLTGALRREGGWLYTVLDILNGVGLELQLDNKPIESHQELIDYINDRDLVSTKITSMTGIFDGTIKRFRDGDNVSFDKALKIIDAMGIEVRVV